MEEAVEGKNNDNNKATLELDADTGGYFLTWPKQNTRWAEPALWKVRRGVNGFEAKSTGQGGKKGSRQRGDLTTKSTESVGVGGNGNGNGRRQSAAGSRQTGYRELWNWKLAAG